jgi:hypothetical protein
MTPTATLTWLHEVFGNTVATATFHSASDNLDISSVAEIQLDTSSWPVFDIADMWDDFRDRDHLPQAIPVWRTGGDTCSPAPNRSVETPLTRVPIGLLGELPRTEVAPQSSAPTRNQRCFC